jgi:uncharacterized protein with von Willebrand factor type A (vWA) domain
MLREHVVRRATRARKARSGDLPHDVAVFADLLHSLGASVSPSACLQAVRALTFVRLDRRRDFRAALECCLTGSTENSGLFDLVFDTFWSAEDGQIPLPRGESEAAGEGDTVRGAGDLPAQSTEPATPGRPDRDGLAGQATYSRARGQAGGVTFRQRREIDELSRRLARALGTAAGRRLVTAERGHQVDLRETMRHNLRYGDEILVLRRTTPRRDRPRVVVLCDVSSSMRPYTPLFLGFVHSLTKTVRQVESAVFNVELVMVTELFRRTRLNRALAWLSHHEVALSGGTRIGHCLNGFLDDLERRGALRPDTIAVILSDGWDVGEADLLRDGMRRLRGQVGRVVWCDPHAASTDFRPQVQGLRLALPYVDDYLDFSSVSALSGLVARLEKRPSTALLKREDPDEFTAP